MFMRKVFCALKLYFIKCLIAPLYITFGVILFICVLFYNQISLAYNVFNLLGSYDPVTDQSIYEQAMTAIVENAAPEVDIVYLPYGDKFAELTIESVNIKDVTVFNCDDYSHLNHGYGRSNYARYPGEGGKTVLSGHLKTNAALYDVEVGAEIIIKTVYGTFRYTVTDISVVLETDSTILAPDDTKEQLLLYTCYPKRRVGHHYQRLLITSILKSGPVVKNIPFKD